ncbi:zinc-binding dehydrogenase, partial [Aquabacterium sp.]|uniref:zinc-binding dehydrogenase n=1 Tax=Aquabacterium sp. TaxID=1872578 RepID=UPI0035C757AB
VEAAALPETLFTVWTNLFERAYVVGGDRVLVHGGTSGIGTMAISLCRLFDIEIIVTCGSDDKCAQALEWGASHAINYKTSIFLPTVMSKRLTLTGSTLRPRSSGFKSLVADEIMRTVWPFVEQGKLRPAMDQRFALADAAKAHARMDAGEHFGKIVLTV